MRSVFVLQHIARRDTADEDAKLIGIYSSLVGAEQAVSRIKAESGFREHPDGFHIDEYEVDKDHWTEGFVSADEASAD